MEEMSPYDVASPPLHAILDAAQCFGLSEDEAWDTAAATLRDLGPEFLVSDSIDELVAALAGRILARERRALAERRRAAFETL
jgi:hypothetical protein